jgi:hypothetical protein
MKKNNTYQILNIEHKEKDKYNFLVQLIEEQFVVSYEEVFIEPDLENIGIGEIKILKRLGDGNFEDFTNENSIGIALEYLKTIMCDIFDNVLDDVKEQDE